MTEHPDLLLSAYLDGELDALDRGRVAAHLEGCDRCRARLAELRATSRLIAALPSPVPARSLVPAVGRAPVWLRPVRLLGSMGGGLFLFLFIASAVVNSGSSLGGGTTTAERLAEKGQFGAAVNALASDSAAKAIAPNAGAPAPQVAGPSGPTGSTGAAQEPRTDIARTTSGTAAPIPTTGSAAFNAGPTGAAASFNPAGRQVGPPPVAFLALAVACALVAFVAHRRLRRS